MKNYQEQDNRKFVVIFLTDGLPLEDTPNEIGEYQYLKNEYPFITINAIQFEMGNSILEEIKKVSDYQFVADMENIESILYNISLSPIKYSNFIITDYIDKTYFNIENIESIKVNNGKVDFDEQNQKIVWNLEQFNSGLKANMNVKVKLKSEYINQDNNYPISTRTEVETEIDGTLDNVNTTLTPVVANKYNVHYDGNRPSDCSVSGIPSDLRYQVFDTVSIAKEPKCSGYQFKGWDIVNDNVTKVNDDYFVMPEEDVTLKANWSKLGLVKSTDGKVSTGLTLYKQIEEDTKDSSKFAKKYTGAKDTFKGTQEVYYYYGAATNNNVVFANYCWKIVRTTDTGGVKLLYNGVPSSDGKCNNSGFDSALTAEQEGRGSATLSFNSSFQYLSAVGYMFNDDTKYDWHDKDMSNLYGNSLFEKKLSKTSSTGEFYAGDSYTFDGNSYTVTGTTYVGHSFSVDSPPIGTYFCNNPYSSTCNTLNYYVNYNTENEIEVISSDLSLKISRNVLKDSRGKYSLENPTTVSLKDWVNNNQSYVNYYMCEDNNTTSCNKLYKIIETSISGYSYIPVMKLSESYSGEFYAGDSYTQDGNNFTVTGNTSVGHYVSADSPSKGTYFCNNAYSSTCNTLFYYVDYHNYDGGVAEVVSSDLSLKIASSINKNSNGTYTLNDPVTVNFERWLNEYSNFRDYYICEDSISTTCSNVYKIANTSLSEIELGNSDEYYRFGNSFTYNNGKYVLKNTKIVGDWARDYESLNNYHYTCFNVGGECSTLNYVYYGNNNKAYYIELTGGKNISNALDEMLYGENINTHNSNVKNAVDYWYQHYMTEYTPYLEDTVWCNDRSMSNQSTNGWNPNGGSLTTYLNFTSYSNTADLTCKNVRDRFSVNSANGNGALTYPTGLLTRQEQALAYSSSTSPFINGKYFWLLSPHYYSENVANGFVLNPSGSYDNHGVNGERGNRPAISLHSGAEYSSGDGSANKPYVINVS